MTGDSLYLAFIVASVLLILFPGPNVALIIASSLSDGRRGGLMTLAGVNLGLSLQLVLTVGGLGSLMLLLADWLEWLRWAGVAYLLWLGIQHWRRRTDAETTPTVQVRGRKAFARGLAVSLLNPKTMLFHAAFLPQFIDPAGDPLTQMAVLGLTFIVIAALIDGFYALAAARAARLLAIGNRRQVTDRITGSLLIGAGIGLALARRG